MKPIQNERYAMTNDSATAVMKSPPCSRSAASVTQKVLHLGHFATSVASSANFSAMPRCCPNIAAMPAVNAIHHMTYATVMVNGVSLTKFRPHFWQPTAARSLTDAPCVRVSTGAVPVFEMGNVKSCDNGCWRVHPQSP